MSSSGHLDEFSVVVGVAGGGKRTGGLQKKKKKTGSGRLRRRMRRGSSHREATQGVRIGIKCQKSVKLSSWTLLSFCWPLNCGYQPASPATGWQLGAGNGLGEGL